MTISTSSLITGISQPRIGSMTSVANTGATRPAITSTQGTSAESATNNSDSDSSVSTGEEGKAKTDEGKKPEGKPGAVAQDQKGISDAAKAATKTFTGSEIAAGMAAQAEADAKAAAASKTKDDSSWAGAGAQTNIPSFESSNSMPKGEALQKTFDTRGELIGGHSQNDITNRNTASSDNSY